jgi:hypothetical protein
MTQFTMIIDWNHLLIFHYHFIAPNTIHDFTALPDTYPSNVTGTWLGTLLKTASVHAYLFEGLANLKISVIKYRSRVKRTKHLKASLY